ncbi:MAG: carboxypeptidase regulatory-like domain-containing protein [Gemmatimonadales bacterium]
MTLVASAALTPCGAQHPQLGRLLGIFDDATGQPVIGAEVVDLATGSKTATSVTGTATIAWLGPGTTLLQVRKLGYASKMVPVSTSASDTASITVVLTPLAPTLPAVVSKARSPGDSVRRLELSGFYDRRRGSGAPQSAFVTAADLDKWNLMYPGDVKRRNGRGICGGTGDTYVDGMFIAGGVWLGPGDNGTKLRLQMDEIAGIETYTHDADIPAQYSKPRRKSLPPPCVTLIWLR